MKEVQQNKIFKIVIAVLAFIVAAMSVGLTISLTKSDSSIDSIRSELDSMKGVLSEKEKENAEINEKKASEAESYSNELNEQSEKFNKEKQSLNNKISDLNKQIAIKRKNDANKPANPSAPSNSGVGKTVYLTFDDGPSSFTPEILRILNENGVKATFFVTNQGRNNKYMKNIVDEGHVIALHTSSHNYNELYSSEEAYYKDLQKISDIVYDNTGVRSNIIRFPGGSSNGISININKGIMSRLVVSVQEKGYQYYDWNASSGDAAKSGIISKKTILDNCRSLPKSSTVMVLMHDTGAKKTTVEALPEIIAYYKSIGCSFGVITKNTPPIHQSVIN